MPVGLVIAGIGLALGVAGTGLQIAQAREAQSEARKNRIRQGQQNELQARRERLQAIATGRRRRAAALNAATVAGAADQGSSVQGGIDATLSQAGAEVGFTQQSLGLSSDIGRGNQAISNAQFRGQLFQLAGDTGFAVANNAGGLAEAGTRLFQTPQTTPTIGTGGGGFFPKGFG